VLREKLNETLKSALKSGNKRAVSTVRLILTAGDSVVRFTPPLIITEADVDRGVAILDEVLAEVLA